MLSSSAASPTVSCSSSRGTRRRARSSAAPTIGWCRRARASSACSRTTSRSPGTSRTSATTTTTATRGRPTAAMATGTPPTALASRRSSAATATSPVAPRSGCGSSAPRGCGRWCDSLAEDERAELGGPMFSERARVYDPPVGGTPPRLEAVPARTRTTLATNAAWLLGSNIAYAACQWGAVVALAKFSAPAALGYFGLALAVTNPIVLVTGFALKAYQSTDVRGQYAFSDYVNLRMAANVVAALMVGAIILVGVVTGTAGAVLVPVAVAKLADATSETCYGVAQKHERMRFVAIAKTLRGALGLAGLALVIVLGGSVVGGAWW